MIGAKRALYGSRTSRCVAQVDFAIIARAGKSLIVEMHQKRGNDRSCNIEATGGNILSGCYRSSLVPETGGAGVFDRADTRCWPVSSKCLPTAFTTALPAKLR